MENFDPGLVHEKLGALRLGASIGFACFPQDGKDAASLLSVADIRMYHDKTERKLCILADRERGESHPVPEAGPLRLAA